MMSRVERDRGLGRAFEKAVSKEAAGAADAGLMQIEWSKEEVLKLTGVGTEAEEEVRGRVGGRIEGGKRWERGHEVGMGLGAGRTGAERGGPCSVLELGASSFMLQ
jgi:hypothetical protein